MYYIIVIRRIIMATVDLNNVDVDLDDIAFESHEIVDLMRMWLDSGEVDIDDVYDGDISALHRIIDKTTSDTIEYVAEKYLDELNDYLSDVGDSSIDRSYKVLSEAFNLTEVQVRLALHFATKIVNGE